MKDRIIDERGMIDLSVSDYDRVIIIYSQIVRIIEKVSIKLSLDPKMNLILRKLTASVDFLSLEKQVRRFNDELIKFDESGITVEAEPIDSKRLHILVRLRGRAIVAFRTLLNVRDNTKDDLQRENLKGWIPVMLESLNHALGLIRLHPRMTNDTFFQNIEEDFPKNLVEKR